MGLEDDLRLRLRHEYDHPQLLEVQDVVLKKGPQAWKTAALLSFGDKETGEVKRRTLRVQTWERRPDGRFGFERKADFRWSCDDAELIALAALLNEHPAKDGDYSLVAATSQAALIQQLSSGDAGSIVNVVVSLLQQPAVREALAASDAATTEAALVTAVRHRAALVRLRGRVLDPGCNEAALHARHLMGNGGSLEADS